ncbi:TPA: hypothetical protein QB638_000111 [Pasteurella multocida]|nr:hypothetical protein [Pasteurella multocida]HDR1923777.1 hypothetical protein [Pasteurella multocida]
MFKAFELKESTPPESEFQSIMTSYNQMLRRLHEQGIVERDEVVDEGEASPLVKWRLKSIQR